MFNKKIFMKDQINNGQGVQLKIYDRYFKEQFMQNLVTANFIS